MKKDNHINVHIASDQDMNQAFVNARKKADKGLQREGEEHLYFESPVMYWPKSEQFCQNNANRLRTSKYNRPSGFALIG